MRAAGNIWENEFQTLRGFVLRLIEPESQAARIMAEALEKVLTPRQREMIYLYYVEKMTMKDIAKSLGLNPSTVSRTIRLGREKLKICINVARAGLMQD